MPVGSEADLWYAPDPEACGHAAMAFGAAARSLGWDFRILQLNVGPEGARHVIVEVQEPDGRWVLYDPLFSGAPREKGDARARTLDELRALSPEQLSVPDPRYLTEWSLAGPARRTSWGHLEILSPVLPVSVRAWWMQHAFQLLLGTAALALSVALWICARAAKRRPLRRP
jgi:hypothetical protein